MIVLARYDLNCHPDPTVPFSEGSVQANPRDQAFSSYERVEMMFLRSKTYIILSVSVLLSVLNEGMLKYLKVMSDVANDCLLWKDLELPRVPMDEQG